MGDLNKLVDRNGFVISRTVLGGMCEDFTGLVGTRKINHEENRGRYKEGAYLHLLMVDI
jgi:hypothetical protein